MKNNCDFKGDNTPTMLLSIQLIKFLILLMRSSSLQESLLTCQMHFDTVDHSILLKKKLKLYGITKLTKILHASKVTYNRKQYNETGENSKTDLLYVNYLSNLSHLLDSVMFADDTNLFFNNKDFKHLFTVVNNELLNIKDRFTHCQ